MRKGPGSSACSESAWTAPRPLRSRGEPTCALVSGSSVRQGALDRGRGRARRLGSGLGGGAAVEWGLGVVFHRELDRAGGGLASDPGGEVQGHVDAGRDAGGGDELAALDHALLNRTRAENRSVSSSSQCVGRRCRRAGRRRRAAASRYTPTWSTTTPRARRAATRAAARRPAAGGCPGHRARRRGSARRLRPTRRHTPGWRIRGPPRQSRVRRAFTLARAGERPHRHGAGANSPAGRVLPRFVQSGSVATAERDARLCTAVTGREGFEDNALV